MGLRFRKSIGSKGVRINISKSGVGYSVGGKGFRVTKTAKGTTRQTLSIPGTGISYVTETSNKSNASIGGNVNSTSSSFRNSTYFLILAIIVSTLLLITAIISIVGYINEQEYQKKYIETFYDYNIAYTGDYKVGNNNKWITMDFILTNLSNSDKDYDITIHMYTDSSREVLLASGKAGILGTGVRVAAGARREISITLEAPNGETINLLAGDNNYHLQITTDISDNGYAPPRLES